VCMQQRLVHVEEPILNEIPRRIEIPWSRRDWRQRRCAERQYKSLVISQSRRKTREHIRRIWSSLGHLVQGLKCWSTLPVVIHATGEKRFRVGAKVCIGCAHVCVRIVNGAFNQDRARIVVWLCVQRGNRGYAAHRQSADHDLQVRVLAHDLLSYVCDVASDGGQSPISHRRTVDHTALTRSGSGTVLSRTVTNDNEVTARKEGDK